MLSNWRSAALVEDIAKQSVGYVGHADLHPVLLPGEDMLDGWHTSERRPYARAFASGMGLPFGFLWRISDFGHCLADMSH